MTRRRTLLAPVLVLAVALAGCGDDGDDGEETGASTTTEATSSTAAEGGSTTEADGSTTTDGDGSTTTAPAGDLPGEVLDIYPYEGARLAVVGVAADDTLNVRSGPGTDFDVVTELSPLFQDATATGQNRTVDESLWVELEADGATGWVNGAYVAEPGQTTDVTADIGAVGGETMVDIGEAVAATRASVEEGPQPTVTVVDGPTVADVGQIAVDVLGLADDSVKGERLHIVASPDASGEGFTVTSVEATTLCARGVTAEGLCT